jgi:uncharacterized secreted protein with C-terminal beta-propeller domain
VGKRTALIALVAATSAAVAVGTLESSAARMKKEPARLLRFGACSDFLDYMKQHAAPSVTPSGFLDQVGLEAVGPVPPPSPLPPVAAGIISIPATSAPATPKASETEPDVSSTNVQEAGIDEPDLAKTDGSSLFAVAGGKLRSVDVSGERPRGLDSLNLQGGPDHELLLRGDTLIVLSHAGEEAGEVGRVVSSSPGLPTPEPHIQPRRDPTTMLTEVDVSRPGWMKVVRRLTFPGRYLSARLVKGTARVVFSSRVPNGLSFFRPRSYVYPGEAFERNRAVIANSTARNWLPSYEIRNVRTKAKTKRLVQCRHISRPPKFSGFGMLTALTIDLDKGVVPVEADSVLGDGDLVYASEKSLYVATQAWLPEFGFDRSAQPPGETTSLHKFNISNPRSTAYSASGTIPGYLLNQWALSEHEGVLRAATTLSPPWRRGGSSQSVVVALREQAGKLVEVGRIGGLGRGERIFGVRFIGDVGYVVTFRQIDPLYTIDLSTPSRPRLLGELKIPGYSAYLHPLGENLLLGLGQEASDNGLTSAALLSVFDVSDLRKPVRLHRRTIEGASSEAETDHHAFLYWSRSRLVVVPVSTLDEFEGVVGFRIGRDRVQEIGRIKHTRRGGSGSTAWTDSEAIRRTFVVRNTLLTVSAAGVRANDVRTFEDRGWTAFR